ncbi:hypothetical protein TRFO_41511 [Tritrichomonas foetus]|uniref:Right handed beta helix domain-containing protein n=1 Tax=Tritrichomonas foetus TaxID=1144522 RepID=A0A1J4L027_9EUKA|nr:hypothetical protein TRFO_41511 [Tritrichomonas foetus]|eukprot:OHT16865.1 hypothetical protein TRFO_41511 [Tritrichomonas foetus]
MNRFLLNLTLAILTTSHYSNSPLLSSSSHVRLKQIRIDRSFTNFIFNIPKFNLQKSSLRNFLQTPIKVSKDSLSLTGNYQTASNLNGLADEVIITDSIFYNCENGIYYDSEKASKIRVNYSSFIQIKGNSAIDFSGGATLQVDSTCFLNNSASFIAKLATSNNIPSIISTSSFFELHSDSTSPLHTEKCSIEIINNNFTGIKSHNLLYMNEMDQITILYFTAINSIGDNGINIINDATNSNFRYLNIIVNSITSNRDSSIFTIDSGFFTIYNSNFEFIQKTANLPGSNLATIADGMIYFIQCFSSEGFASNSFFTLECYPTIFWSPSIDEFPLKHCKDGIIGDIAFNTNNPELEKVAIGEKFGSGELIGGLAIGLSGIVILIIVFWLLIYFCCLKNPLKEFNKDDDETQRWLIRWNWIVKHSRGVKHHDCSDIEIYPIERSDEAINRRRNEFFDESAGHAVNLSEHNSVDERWNMFLINNDLDDKPSQESYKDDENPQNENQNSFSINEIHHSESSSSNHLAPSQNPTESEPEPPIDQNNSDKITEEEEKHEGENIHESESEPEKVEIIPPPLEKKKTTWEILKETGVDSSLGSVESSDSWNESDAELPTKRTTKPLNLKSLPQLQKKDKDKESSKFSDSWSTDFGSDAGASDTWSDEGDVDGEFSSSFSD